MYKIVSFSESCFRSKSYSEPIYPLKIDIAERWNIALTLAGESPALSKSDALDLVSNVKTCIQRRLEIERVASDCDQKTVVRLTQRLVDLDHVEDFIQRDQILLFGFLGWGDLALKPAEERYKLQPRENISDYDSIVFKFLAQDQENFYIEKLGSSFVLSETKQLDDRLSDVKESSTMIVMNSPNSALTDKGRLSVLYKGASNEFCFDSGCYVTSSDKGYRKVFEAPLENTVIVRVQGKVQDKSIQGDLDGAVMSGGARDQTRLLIFPPEHKFRFGVVLYSNLEIDQDGDSEPVSNVLLVSKEPVTRSLDLFSEDNVLQQFLPDYGARINNVMCNASCTPEINNAAKALVFNEGQFFQSMYFKD